MRSSVVTWWVSRRPYLLSILRIVSAFLFLQFGTAKLFALPGAIMPDGGTAVLLGSRRRAVGARPCDRVPRASALRLVG